MRCTLLAMRLALPCQSSQAHAPFRNPCAVDAPAQAMMSHRLGHEAQYKHPGRLLHHAAAGNASPTNLCIYNTNTPLMIPDDSSVIVFHARPFKSVTLPTRLTLPLCCFSNKRATIPKHYPQLKAA